MQHQVRMFWGDGKASKTAGLPYPINIEPDTKPSTSGRSSACFCQSDISINVTSRSANRRIGQQLQRDTGMLRFAAMSITASSGRERRGKTGKQCPASILINVQKRDEQDDMTNAPKSRHSQRSASFPPDYSALSDFYSFVFSVGIFLIFTENHCSHFHSTCR